MLAAHGKGQRLAKTSGQADWRSCSLPSQRIPPLQSLPRLPFLTPHSFNLRTRRLNSRIVRAAGCLQAGYRPPWASVSPSVSSGGRLHSHELATLFCHPVSPCFPEPPRSSPIPWGPIVACQTDRQTDSWADLDVGQQPNGNLLFMLKIKLTSNLSPGPPFELPVSECCSQHSLKERKHHPALPHSHPGGGQGPPRLHPLCARPWLYHQPGWRLPAGN